MHSHITGHIDRVWLCQYFPALSSTKESPANVFVAQVTLDALAREYDPRINSYLRRALFPFYVHTLDRESVVDDYPSSEMR